MTFGLRDSGAIYIKYVANGLKNNHYKKFANG